MHMELKDTIAHWVRDARKSAKLSGEELGAKLALELKTERGHSKGNISHWELGKHQPSIQQLLAISKITTIPLPEVLLSKLPSSTREAGYPQSNVRAVEAGKDYSDLSSIRKVKLKLSAGITGFNVELVEEDGNPIFFRNDWLESRGYKVQNLIATPVTGDSMEPGMHDKDTVVLNAADREPRDGEVFAINYEGEAIIKRLVRDAGDWWLSSDNPDQRRYPRKLCSGDACIILGRIVHKQSERI